MNLLYGWHYLTEEVLMEITYKKLQQITPIIGFNYNRFMFSYTYSKQIGDIQFSDSAFHQVTVRIKYIL